MFALYSLVPLIQVLTAIHAIKTGRSYYWLWIILFFPMVGTLVYLVVEVIPDFRQVPSRGALTTVLNAVQPDRELRLLKENLAFSNTVQNRKLLADYYLDHDLPTEAIEHYRECLRGVHAGDPSLSFNLAIAYCRIREFESARELLEDMARHHPIFQAADRDLILARILEEQGDDDRAIQVYQSLVAIHTGEEPRYRLACLYQKQGDLDRARSLFQEILTRSKRFTAYQRRTQKEWVTLAKRRLNG